MSGFPKGLLLTLTAGAAAAFGQAVISTHSGVVHFFEGPVTVSGQPLEARFGRFATIPDGGELRTEQGGRAEVLLTPGVFLRVGEKSAIRLVSSNLTDTKVELLGGSAILASAEPSEGTSVTLQFQKWNLVQSHAGTYRIDSDPPRIQVQDGEVKVWATGDAPVVVQQGMDLALQAVLVPDKSAGGTHDALNDWADGRNQSISADNAIASNIQDPATMSDPYGVADAFTYFPLLGYPALGGGMVGTYSGLSVSPYGAGMGMYGVASPLYQPGFYSIYLPGYTYRPAYLHLPGTVIGTGYTGLGGLGGRPLYPPTRIGGSTTVPRVPVMVPHTTPLTHPAVPVAPHPVGHIGK